MEDPDHAFPMVPLDDDPALLYEQAPCGYLSTTDDGSIVKVNATLCTWLGREPSGLLGRRFAELLTPGSRIYHETHYGPMLRMQGFVREIAADMVRADGSRLSVLLNASTAPSADHSTHLVRMAIFDATERRSYERELVRARDAAREAELRAEALTHTLQQSFIPPTAPEIPGLAIATAYRPAGDGTEVGGDFYDIFPTGPQDWVVALGDVSGKGVEAAVVTSIVRHTVRALTVLGQGLPEVLDGVDRVVAQHETDKFCTLVVLRLRRDGDGWMSTVAVGGHPPPMLLRPGCEPRMVDARGPVLGLLPDVAFSEWPVDLRPGDTLLLYTDGVTEARLDGEYFGEEQFLAWAAARESDDPSVLVESLLEEVLRFQSGEPRDDIAVVAVRHT
ncbi:MULTISPECIES: PP2C family protein-serine/threonine phosphatase [unclassified Knoellia]|uniref:PP2C family protein-serine/threonine phosphatase n=1 Tax=Knoellia altitudinis TaxID=3404795 RepID=UPI00360C08D9